MLSGCKKEQPVTPQEPAPEPKPVVEQPIDTTDEAVFDAADLEAEFQQKVQENMLTLYFEYNKYDLTSESLERLSKAARFMESEPTLRVRIDGHADERGTAEYNMALGEKRAKTVESYLVKYGIAQNRLEVTSFGKEKPAQICDEGDDACQSKNRRVEYMVLGH
ncbi:MAG: peptidoglycan-associated lipoprotein [Sulfurospirillum sp.]|nr:MAG: peptidoglycan-associated lipoprotein [Sulfurospirillum sp.]